MADPKQASSSSNEHKSSSAASDTASSSSSWFSGLQETIGTIMDGQRVERLKQCRVLEDIAAECRRKRTSADASEQQQDRVQLEDVPEGIRIVKFYRWRGNHDYDSTCQREEHAVWSCRAVCLGCGQHMVEAQTCYSDNTDALLKASKTAYENNTGSSTADDERIPCQSIQQKIGACVAEGSKALLDRHMAREQKAAAKEATS